MATREALRKIKTINPSGLTDGDWSVILHQGRYFRFDAGEYMSDAEHRAWLTGRDDSATKDTRP